MVAACPKCQAKYRVDPALLGPGGARLRCAKCQAVFRVRAPEPAPAAVPPAPSFEPAPAPVVPQAPPAPPSPPAPVAAPEPTLDRERVVLVADPDVEAGKGVSHQLAGFGLQPVLVHDGVEALLTVQRMLPKAVILDAALPKMYGFQICEMMKRNESLRSIQVVLVGSVHHQDRYRRPPSELYGADVYLEKPELMASLGKILQSFGYDLANAAAPPQPSFQASPPVAPPQPSFQASPPVAPPQPSFQASPPVAPPQPSFQASPPVAPPQAPPRAEAPPQAFAPTTAPPHPAAPAPQEAPVADDGLAQLRAEAERLARIIVSDILLYHPDQFEAGRSSGQLAQTLAGAIEEGRGFFAQRVDPRVRDDRDYLMDELQRVARERGGP